MRYAEKIRETIRQKLRIPRAKSSRRYFEEIAELRRHRHEADEDLVAVALRYVDSPGLLVADFKKVIGEDFANVFCKRERKVTWRFWELFFGADEEWQISGGVDRCKDYCGVYAATGLPFTDEQVRYSFRLERFTIAATLAKSRAPGLFRGVDIDQLADFRQACLAIRHGKRAWVGEPDPSTLKHTIAAVAMRIQFDTALAEGETAGVPPAGESLPPLDMFGVETPEASQTPAVSVNAQMLDIMQSVGNEVCLEWSVEDWRDKLFERFRRKPSKSTIHKQPTWDLIRTLRVQTGAETLEHQTTRDQTGKRRSRVD